MRLVGLGVVLALMAAPSCGQEADVATGVTVATDAQDAGCEATSLPNKFQKVPDFSAAIAEPAPADAAAVVGSDQAIALVVEQPFQGLPVEPHLVILTVPPMAGTDGPSIDHQLTWALVYAFPEGQQMFQSGPAEMKGRPPPCIATEMTVYVDATTPQDTWLFTATRSNPEASATA